MKNMRTLADLNSDIRILSVDDERQYGNGWGAYANSNDGYFIEGTSDIGSYVQIHEDSLREVLKQANRIKHFSEFSESDKEDIREWAKENRHILDEADFSSPQKNPVKPRNQVSIEKGIGMKMKMFKEERVNPKAGTEGLHFVVTQDDAGDTVLHVFDSEDQAGLYHGQLRGYGGVKRIGRLKGSKSMSFGYINNGVAKQFGAEPRMIRHDQGESNPFDPRSSSRKENYDDFDEWERDAFAAGATQIVKLGDGFSALRTKDGSMVKVDAEGYFDPRSRDAIKNRKNRINIGAWFDNSGVIYRHIIKKHPEFYTYQNPYRPKQRIAVCLSKSRKRNPLESGATISDDEDINRQASKMG